MSDSNFWAIVYSSIAIILGILLSTVSEIVLEMNRPFVFGLALGGGVVEYIAFGLFKQAYF